MKVVCVGNIIEIENNEAGEFYKKMNRCGWYITVGKIYNVNRISGKVYKIINDKSDLMWYPECFFITMSEYRNKKLKEIGI